MAFVRLYLKCLQTLPSSPKAEVAAAGEKLKSYLEVRTKTLSDQKVLNIFIYYWNAQPGIVGVGYFGGGLSV